MNLHRTIAEALVKQAKDSQSPLFGMLEGKDTHQVCHTIFVSYRSSGGQGRGLRLSDEGLQLMKAFFKCYDVSLTPGYKLSLPHLLYLDRIAEMPYWVSDKHCALFDSDLAMMLRLTEGKIQDLVESRFRLNSSDNYLNPNS